MNEKFEKRSRAWLETKEIGKLKIDKGVNQYRINMDGKLFYLARKIEKLNKDTNSKIIENRDLAYNDSDSAYFEKEINDCIQTRKPGRKERKANYKYWKKIMKKMKKNPTVKTINATPNVDTNTPIENIVLEAKENMQKALSDAGISQEDVLPGVSDEEITNAIIELEEENKLNI